MVFLKNMLGYDDALDTFGVHGVGGTLGAILTGVLADEKANSVVGGLKAGLMMEQFKAIAVTIVLSVVATAVIAFIVKAVIGLRPTPEEETAGLDLTDHGKRATSSKDSCRGTRSGCSQLDSPGRTLQTKPTKQTP